MNTETNTTRFEFGCACHDKEDDFLDNDDFATANSYFTFKQPRQPNFILAFDDMGYEQPFGIQFEFTVKKTSLARIKYWLFCKFFPFKIKRWDV